MDKRYYKVVRKFEGLFTSTSLHPNLKLQYRIGERTYPKINNSKLFIFNTFDNAVLFMGFSSLCFEILECNALISDINLLAIPINSGYLKEKENFWNDIKEGREFQFENFCIVPAGTLAADWIEPIKIA